MYENVGQSIKNVVSIIVKIGYALSIIGAIILVLTGLTAGNFGLLILYLVVAAFVGGLGCLAAWLSGLWLYAYGEIADRLISIDEQLAALKSAAHASNPNPAPKQASTTPVYSSTPSSTYCASCGARNNSSARYCVACSAEMPRVVTKPNGNTWTCACGRVNAAYVGTCTCGKSKRDAIK